MFHEKKKVEKKAEKIMFLSKTTSDGIQIDDQNIDGVDLFHQHLSFTVLNHFLWLSTFHLVTLGSFDLYAV